MIERRCTQRQFLLRPDKKTNNAFLYLLAEASQRYGIGIISVVMMSNHHHAVVYDPNGMISKFMERFHGYVARAVNALRGRWENFFESGAPSRVELINRNAVLAAITYVVTNPVKDNLVETIEDWPGINGYHALMHDEVMVATRPDHFFSPEGTMPEVVELRLTIPEELGDPAQFRSDLQRRVDAKLARLATARAKSGRRVLGRRRVLRQAWDESPTTFDPRRGMSPRVAGRSRWRRIATLQRNKQFERDYRIALLSWRAGNPVPFPAGTNALHRNLNVPVVGFEDPVRRLTDPFEN